MLDYLQQFFQQILSMGIYAYVLFGFIILGIIYMIGFFIFNKNAKASWLASHPGAVKITIETGVNLITQKSLNARVISGEAKVFTEKAHYIVLAMPGTVVLEVRYTYTRPGIMYKNVTTTYGPTNIELALEKEKEYTLTFDRKEENFKLSEK